MDSDSGTFGTGHSDPRDGCRNGFIDAVLYMRGIVSPTRLQLEDAICLLGDFRAVQAVMTDANRPNQRLPGIRKSHSVSSR